MLIHVVLQVLLVPLALLIALVLTTLSPRAVAWLVTFVANWGLKKTPGIERVEFAEIRIWRRKPVLSGVFLQLRSRPCPQHHKRKSSSSSNRSLHGEVDAAASSSSTSVTSVALGTIELTGLFKFVRNIILNKKSATNTRCEVLVRTIDVATVSAGIANAEPGHAQEDHAWKCSEPTRDDDGDGFSSTQGDADETPLDKAAHAMNTTLQKLSSMLEKLGHLAGFIRFQVLAANYEDSLTQTRVSLSKFALEGNFDRHALDLIVSLEDATVRRKNVFEFETHHMELKFFVATLPLHVKSMNFGMDVLEIFAEPDSFPGAQQARDPSSSQDAASDDSAVESTRPYSNRPDMADGNKDQNAPRSQILWPPISIHGPRSNQEPGGVGLQTAPSTALRNRLRHSRWIGSNLPTDRPGSAIPSCQGNDRPRTARGRNLSFKDMVQLIVPHLPSNVTVFIKTVSAQVKLGGTMSTISVSTELDLKMNLASFTGHPSSTFSPFSASPLFETIAHNQYMNDAEGSVVALNFLQSSIGFTRAQAPDIFHRVLNVQAFNASARIDGMPNFASESVSVHTGLVCQSPVLCATPELWEELLQNVRARHDVPFDTRGTSLDVDLGSVSAWRHPLSHEQLVSFAKRCSADIICSNMVLESRGRAAEPVSLVLTIDSVRLKCVSLVSTLKIDQVELFSRKNNVEDAPALCFSGIVGKGWIVEQSGVINMGPLFLGIDLPLVVEILNQVVEPVLRVLSASFVALTPRDKKPLHSLDGNGARGWRSRTLAQPPSRGWVLQVRIVAPTASTRESPADKGDPSLRVDAQSDDSAASLLAFADRRRAACSFFPQLAAASINDSIAVVRFVEGSAVGLSFRSIGAAVTIPANSHYASTQAEGGIQNLQIFILEQVSPTIVVPSVSVKVLSTPLGSNFLSNDVTDRWQIPSGARASDAARHQERDGPASSTQKDKRTAEIVVQELPLLLDIAVPKVTACLDFDTEFGVAIQSIVRLVKTVEHACAPLQRFYKPCSFASPRTPQKSSTANSQSQFRRPEVFYTAAIGLDLSIEQITFECLDAQVSPRLNHTQSAACRNLGTFCAEELAVQFCFLQQRQALYQIMQELDNAPTTPPDSIFLKLFGGYLLGCSVAEFRFLLGAFPIPFVSLKRLSTQGAIVLSELVPHPRFTLTHSVRLASLPTLGNHPPSLEVQLPIPSLKFYHDLCAAVAHVTVVFGGLMERMMGKQFGPRMERVGPPKSDPSPKLPPWDVLRFLFHGAVLGHVDEFHFLMLPGYPEQAFGLRMSARHCRFFNMQCHPLRISAEDMELACIEITTQAALAPASRGQYVDCVDPDAISSTSGLLLKVPWVEFVAKFEWLSRGDQHDHYIHLQRFDAATLHRAAQIVEHENSQGNRKTRHSSQSETSDNPTPDVPMRGPATWVPPVGDDSFFWFRAQRANVQFSIRLVSTDIVSRDDDVASVDDVDSTIDDGPVAFLNDQRSHDLHRVLALMQAYAEPIDLRDKVKFSQLWRLMDIRIETPSFVLLWWENMHSIEHVDLRLHSFDCTIELASDLPFMTMDVSRTPESRMEALALATSQIQVGHGFSIPDSIDFDESKEKSIFLSASALSIAVDRRLTTGQASSSEANMFVCEDFRGLWNMRNRDIGFLFGTSMFRFGVGFIQRGPEDTEVLGTAKAGSGRQGSTRSLSRTESASDSGSLPRIESLSAMERILLSQKEVAHEVSVPEHVAADTDSRTLPSTSNWVEAFRINFRNVTLHFVAEEWDSAVTVYAHNACATRYFSDVAPNKMAGHAALPPDARIDATTLDVPQMWEFQLSKVDAVNAATDIQIQVDHTNSTAHYPSLIHRVIKNFEIRVAFFTNIADSAGNSRIVVDIPRLHVDATSDDFSTFVSVIQYVLIVKPSSASPNEPTDSNLHLTSPQVFATIFNLGDPQERAESELLCACRWQHFVLYDSASNAVPTWSERGVHLGHRNGWPQVVAALDSCSTVDITSAVVLPAQSSRADTDIGLQFVANKSAARRSNQDDGSVKADGRRRLEVHWFAGPYCIKSPVSAASGAATSTVDPGPAKIVRISEDERWSALPAPFNARIDAAVCGTFWPPFANAADSECLVVYFFHNHWYIAFDVIANCVIGTVRSIRDGFPASSTTFSSVDLPAIHSAFCLGGNMFLIYGWEYVCPQESRHARRLRSRFSFASDRLFSENAGPKLAQDLHAKMTQAVEASLREQDDPSSRRLDRLAGRTSIEYRISVASIQLQLLDRSQQIFGTLDLAKIKIQTKLYDDSSVILDARLGTIRISESAATKPAGATGGSQSSETAEGKADKTEGRNKGNRRYALSWTFLGPTSMEPNDALLDREMISVQARTSTLQSHRWSNDKAVSVVDFFEIDLFPGMHSSQHPEATPILSLNMTRSLYKKVWIYFFPSKRREKAIADSTISSADATEPFLDAGANNSVPPHGASADAGAGTFVNSSLSIASPKRLASRNAGTGGAALHSGFGRRNSMSLTAQSTFINPISSRKDRNNKMKFYYFKAAKIGAIRVELSARGFPIKVDGWKLKLDSFGFTSVLKTSSNVAHSLKHNYVKLLMKAAGKLAFGKLNRRVVNIPNQLLSKKMILDTSDAAKPPSKSRQWKCVSSGSLREGPAAAKCQGADAYDLRPGDLFTELDRFDHRKKFVVCFSPCHLSRVKEL